MSKSKSERPCFALVLHCHLPYVLHHGTWPHGSESLCEVVTASYLPLFLMMSRLREQGIPWKITFSVSPVVAEQLASPEFQQELKIYVQKKIAACAENKKEFSKKPAGKKFFALASFLEKYHEDLQKLLLRYNADILQGFLEFERDGSIEIITSAATHGYLPLLSLDQSVELQISTAVQTHEKHFHKAPQGIWLPECGYRSRYLWSPPVGFPRGGSRQVRKGLEEIISQCGMRYFFTDSPMALAGDSFFVYQEVFPAILEMNPLEGPSFREAREERTPYFPYTVISKGGQETAVVFVRDSKTSLKIWGRQSGYPGDGDYLEYYKKHFPGGFRYWKVTRRNAELSDKEVYEPAKAWEKAKAHAGHFARLVSKTLKQELTHKTNKREPILCALFDADLFGNFWFEGVEFLYQTFCALKSNGIKSVTCSQYLQLHPPCETITLLEGSWAGMHQVWLNKNTEWIWDRIYDAEHEFLQIADLYAKERDQIPLLRRTVLQTCRELLLLQASDWPFLITTGTARDYAEMRFAELYSDFKRLTDMARHLLKHFPLSHEEEGYLARLERDNNVFEDVKVEAYL